MRPTITGVLLLAAILLGMIVLPGSTQPPPPSPSRTVTIPGSPREDCCLLRLHKDIEGRLVIEKLGTPYVCAAAGAKFKTVRGEAKLTLILRGDKLCDEMPRLIPDDSKLEVEKGTLIRREDQLAHFSGKFTIKTRDGRPLFTGYMEAIHRISTHHKPFGSDDCDENNRLQGWLVGDDDRAGSEFTLRAMFVARTDVADKEYGIAAGNLDGVLIRCP